MQACARWGMCLAGLLGQDWKYVGRKSRNEMQTARSFPHPVDCPQVFTVDKLAGFTYNNNLYLSGQFQRSRLETAKECGHSSPWEVKDTCCLLRGLGWAPSAPGSGELSWLPALDSALDFLSSQLRSVVGLHPPPRRREAGSAGIK